jgi:phosphomannomutase
MSFSEELITLVSKYICGDDHNTNDYFSLLKELVNRRNSHEKGSSGYQAWQEQIDKTYGLIRDEIMQNKSGPTVPVKFGTSGWRGTIGKDLNVRTVSQVTRAIVGIFHEVENDTELAEALGVNSFEEAKSRGCIVGFDNRFGGEILAQAACDVLTGSGINVHYAGETTSGAISASLLEKGAAFSINLTPSHNPLEYGGYKFNGADGGPASAIITDRITFKARDLIHLVPG